MFRERLLAVQWVDGFSSLRDVLELGAFRALRCSVADIADVLDSSKKKRFELSQESRSSSVRGH